MKHHSKDLLAQHDKMRHSLALVVSFIPGVFVAVAFFVFR